MLVEQSENLKSSSTSAQSSILELSLTGEVARVNLNGGSSSCSCSVHEEDGDSKDLNCYDPESVSKNESQLETVCDPSVDQGGSVDHDPAVEMNSSVNIGSSVNHDSAVNIDTSVNNSLIHLSTMTHLSKWFHLATGICWSRSMSICRGRCESFCR